MANRGFRNLGKFIQAILPIFLLIGGGGGIFPQFSVEGGRFTVVVEACLEVTVIAL